MAAESRTATAPRFLPAGDTALVVEFGDRVDPAVNRRVIALGAAVRDAGLPGIVDLVPTFRSLMVHYDPLTANRAAVEGLVRGLLDDVAAEAAAGRLWEIPVLYGEEAGPDLEEVGRRTGLDPDRVVALHSGTVYDIYMMGFLPGLPYLGTIAPELELPRRVEPRVRVPAGTVAIATNLTNVYPAESPGGWHLLGRTPVALFDLRKDPPILLASGDRIRFVPIDRAAYDDLRRRSAAGETVVAPIGEDGT